MRMTSVIGVLMFALGCLTVPTKPAGGDAGTDSSGNDSGVPDFGETAPDPCVGCTPCQVPVGSPGFDMDDDGIVDECDACPFQHNLGGTGPFCDEDFEVSALRGAWVAVWFSARPGADAGAVPIEIQKSQSGNDYYVLEPNNAAVLWTVVSGTRGHVWFSPASSVVFPVSFSGYQGMISRLGDKIVMTEILPEGGQGRGFLVLVRQPRSIVPLGRGGDEPSSPPRRPATSGKMFLSGFLTAATEKVGTFLPLFQIATYGTTDGGTLKLVLGDSGDLPSNEILLLAPDHASSVSVANVRVEPQYSGTYDLVFTFNGASGIPLLSKLTKGAPVSLPGTVSRFQDFAVFSGKLFQTGNVEAALVVVLTRVSGAVENPSSLPTPLYRLGMLDGSQGRSIRSAIVPAQNDASGALDVMDLIGTDFGEEPRFCLTLRTSVARFTPTVNPYGFRIMEDDCLRYAAVVQPRDEEPSYGSGPYTYLWLGNASWGTFFASDVGVTLISDTVDLFSNPQAWSGFAFVIPGRPLATPGNPFDADVDGTPSYMTKTECSPEMIPNGFDLCPCAIGSLGNDGC